MGVLDITDAILVNKWANGVSNLAALSREVGVPTTASLPHAIACGFKNIAALVSEIDYTFKEVETVKEFIADPSKFASVGGGAAAASDAPKTAAVAAVVEEEEEEEMEF